MPRIHIGSRRRSVVATATFVAAAALAGPMAGHHAGAATLATADDRLVVNADFETTDSDPAKIPGWDVVGSGGTVGQSAGGYSGKGLKVTGTTGSVFARSEGFTTLPGEHVTARARLKVGSGATPGLVRLQFWRADGSYVAQRAGWRQTAGVASGSWQMVTVSAYVPDDAVSTTVALVGASGENLWDDVSVTSVPPSNLIIPDAGFEDTRSSAHKPQFWELRPGAVKVNVPVTGTPPTEDAGWWSGDRALQLNDTSASLAPMAISRRLPISGGGYLSASAWARAVSPGDVDGDGDTGTLVLRFYKSDGTTSTLTGKLGTATAWTPIQVTGPVPATATGFDVYIYSDGNVDVGASQWDDVRVSRSDSSGKPVGGYDPSLSTGTALFVGDQRVGSIRGLQRTVHPGSPPAGRTDPRVVQWSSGFIVARSVLQVGSQWWMWTNDRLITSANGIDWPNSGGAIMTGLRPQAVIANPGWVSGGSQPRFFGMAAETEEYGASSCRKVYIPVQSTDGVHWDRVPNSESTPGRDTRNLTHDTGAATPVYVATIKRWQANGTGTTTTCGSWTYQWEPRSAWVMTSPDMKSWSDPTFSLGADVIDFDNVVDRFGSGATTDIYQLPVARYGDQLLGLPWMFDITDEAQVADGGMNKDNGPEHIEIAASRDGITWSRPSRSPLIAQDDPTWNTGFMLTSNELHVTPTETRLYYASYKAGHQDGDPQYYSPVALAVWERDRMVSLGTSGAGMVTTRALQPASDGAPLIINARATGTVRVEVLDAHGVPVPGYTLADSVPYTGDSLDHTMTWAGTSGTKNTLPSTSLTGGRLMLRFSVDNGDLFAYRVGQG